MRENENQNNPEYGHFSGSVCYFCSYHSFMEINIGNNQLLPILIMEFLYILYEIYVQKLFADNF